MEECRYVFNCPVHGKETSSYCFRAFDKENISRWGKLKVVYATVKFEEDELDGYLSFLATLYTPLGIEG